MFKKFKVFLLKDDMLAEIKNIWSTHVKEQFRIIELEDNDLKLEEIIDNSDENTRPGCMFLQFDSEFMFHKGEWILDRKAIRDKAEMWAETD